MTQPDELDMDAWLLGRFAAMEDALNTLLYHNKGYENGIEYESVVTTPQAVALLRSLRLPGNPRISENATADYRKGYDFAISTILGEAAQVESRENP